MKRNVFFLMLIVLVACNNQKQENLQSEVLPAVPTQIDSTDFTNNFYDNEQVYSLKMNAIEIAGEVANPGKVDLSKMPLRSMITKEALPDGGGNKFVGAFRYDGVSLFDILNYHTPIKNNREAFPPIIDLYVVVENAQGEKAVFSWGEIYYPNHLHEIMLATHVMRIVPSKTKELWTLPKNAKMVVGHDLLTSRNIESPTKITVISATREFEIEKGMNPMFAKNVDVFVNNEKTLTINKPVKGLQNQSYETIFYGRGRGIHSTTPFTGQMLKEILAGQVEFNADNIQNGYMIMAAKDGYRGVYTYSEVFNRNDQAEVLLVHLPDVESGGAYKLFPAGDFFSDRAIKSIDRIYFETIN